MVKVHSVNPPRKSRKPPLVKLWVKRCKQRRHLQMLVPRPTPPPCAKASHPPPGHAKEPRWPTLTDADRLDCQMSRGTSWISIWYLYMISEMISLWSLGFVSFFAFEAGICNHCEDLQSTEKPQVSWWRQVKPVMQRAPGVFLEDPVESNRQRWCDSGITVASQWHHSGFMV